MTIRCQRCLGANVQMRVNGWASLVEDSDSDPEDLEEICTEDVYRCLDCEVSGCASGQIGHCEVFDTEDESDFDEHCKGPLAEARHLLQDLLCKYPHVIPGDLIARMKAVLA